MLDKQGQGPPEDLDVALFCIGAAKSGSTWLARVIDEHPEIQVSDPKEPNFFTARGSAYLDRPPTGFLASWETYRAGFPTPGKVNADFSIHTMADPDAAKRIRSVFPQAKFLLILRDPVKRLYSHYRHEERTKLMGKAYVQSLEPTFEQAIENQEFLRRSRYAELLEPWTETFPKDRFHIMTTEAAQRDPVTHVKEVFRFLGVDESFLPAQLGKKVHPHSLDRGIRRRIANISRWLHGHGLGWTVSPISPLVPYRFLKKIDRKKVRYPPLDPALEARLRAQLLPDIQQLEEMFGLRLDHWKPKDDLGPKAPVSRTAGRTTGAATP